VPSPAATARVVGGSLEQANVSMVDRMASLTDVQRTFEALQRGVSVLLNDIDGRAIVELGRR
jgi:flagellar basal body rod protein FlgG